MSKIEKFFKHGNPQLVLQHLEKLRNPNLLLVATGHTHYDVCFRAFERLREIAPEVVERDEVLKNVAERIDDAEKMRGHTSLYLKRRFGGRSEQIELSIAIMSLRFYQKQKEKQ
ncbi:MAG TPA: hypothetical protein VGQ00_04675 [Candidatus Norongarragalinales archaeon]|jgi:hypothetical protein|nr:hypothetical protein [Candidatus Norongarragalinales archaeon]